MKDDGISPDRARATVVALIERNAPRWPHDALHDTNTTLLEVLVERDWLDAELLEPDDSWIDRVYVAAAEAVAVLTWIETFVDPEHLPSPDPDPDIDALQQILGDEDEED